jgi:PAS domain S-box-containing protein
MSTSLFSSFAAGGGEMGQRVRAFDWAATPLGPLSGWPAALRITVDQILASSFPSCLFWGPELIAIYNDAFRPLMGSKPEALGQPFHVIWAEAWTQLSPIAAKALAGESTFIENYLVRVDRSGILEDAWFTFNYGPVFDEHGTVVGMLDTVVETTTQVQSRQRGHAERERLQALLRQMPGFAAVLRGPDHVFEFVNEAYVDIAGPRDFIGRNVRELFPELTGQGFYEILDEVYASGQPFRGDALPVTLDREDGHRYINLLYEPIRDAAGRVEGIFVGGYDVTDHVAAEANLRELNAELEQRVIERTLSRGKAWNVSPELLCVITADGHFETTNPAWHKTLGWTEAEMATQGFRGLVHPEDLSASLDAWAEAFERQQPVLHFENRYRAKDGAWHWLSWVAVPEDGKVYCIARDVSAEKTRQRALAETQEALRQSQKMEAIGQLTGGIAHDFNNLLAAISSSMQVMKIRAAAGQLDDLGRYLEVGERSVRRAAALTQRLLAFSRRQTLDPRPTDVNRLMTGMADLVERTVGPSVQVVLAQAPDLWGTRVDAPQLENALLNLCINARDAMPNGGTITLATHNEVVDTRLAVERKMPPGDHVQIDIIDHGTGMPPEVLARVFDPFFTTKPLGQGTGLGLSMVHGFVHQSGGHVHIDSKVGHGTTISLYLPRHIGPADQEDAARQVAEAPPTGQGETVLLVEDEDTLRDLFREVLEDAGYRVIIAADGAAGLRVLQGQDKVDLLVTDVGLPGGMNGRQLADAGLALRPTMKVLFVTGYADANAVGANGPLDAGMALITKPFDLADLVRKVKEMLC